MVSPPVRDASAVTHLPCSSVHFNFLNWTSPQFCFRTGSTVSTTSPHCRASCLKPPLTSVPPSRGHRRLPPVPPAAAYHALLLLLALAPPPVTELTNQHPSSNQSGVSTCVKFKACKHEVFFCFLFHFSFLLQLYNTSKGFVAPRHAARHQPEGALLLVPQPDEA